MFKKPQKRARKKNNRGLTFVELLVSIAIIGVLASVSYVFYDNYEEKAKERADYIMQQNALALAKTAQLTGYLNGSEPLTYGEPTKVYDTEGNEVIKDGAVLKKESRTLFYNASNGSFLQSDSIPTGSDYQYGQCSEHKEGLIQVILYKDLENNVYLSWKKNGASMNPLYHKDPDASSG